MREVLHIGTVMQLGNYPYLTSFHEASACHVIFSLCMNILFMVQYASICYNAL